MKTELHYTNNELYYQNEILLCYGNGILLHYDTICITNGMCYQANV